MKIFKILYHEEMCDLNRLPSIVKVEAYRLCWAKHVAYIKEKRNQYQI